MAQDAGLDRETAKLLSTVYDDVVNELIVQQRTEATPELISATIIEKVKNGNQEPAKLRLAVLNWLIRGGMLLPLLSVMDDAVGLSSCGLLL
jgi:hypothetical protein